MLPIVPAARRLSVAVAFSLPLAAQCALDWQPGPIASGPHGAVFALGALPNGDLIAGGNFPFADAAVVNCIARWDGTRWNALGGGVSGGLSRVYTVAVAPNGDVFAGGNFTTAGGVAANRVARWDGAQWHALGTGFNNDVETLRVLANGDLLAGGLFSNAGGVPANHVARWNGSTWAPLGAGIPGTPYALAERPNGDLVAAGMFSGGGVAMAWNGATWTSIVTGDFAFALAVLPNGDVAVGGQITTAPTPVNVVVWNGTQTVPLPPQVVNVHALSVAPNGDLVVGGGGTAYPGPTIARWNGVSWATYGTAAPSYVQTLLHDANGNLVIATDGGSGVRLTAAVRRWNGSSFDALGNAIVPPQVNALVRAPNGDVYAGGSFENFGGVPTVNLARWNGAAWNSFGGGVDGAVTALANAPDGSLLVGGAFTHTGGAPASHVARWNGFAWSTLGAGLPFAPTSLAATPSGEVFATNGTDNTLQRFDGAVWSPLSLPQSTGTAGPLAALPNGDLIVGGVFGGVWRYQAGVFTALGYPGTVVAIAVSPAGELTVAGGGFVQRWDGTGWTVLAQVQFFSMSGLAYLPNGGLVVVGQIYSSGTQVGVWQYDGTTWQVVDGGIPLGTPKVVAAADSGDLFVGGDNLVAGGLLSIGFAHATPPCRAAVASFGAGCAGGAGPVALHADSLPWAGGTFASTASGFPASSLAVHAIGDVAAPVPLPLGAPGCSLFVAPFVLDVLLPSAGTAHAAFAIPRDSALAGLVFRTQVVGVELDAFGALTRLTSSNALALTIGAL